MKKLILSFLLVIGITISVFSQTIYPKKILLEGDTIIAITKPQLVTINRSLNDYIHLKKINLNLQMDLIASDSLCSYWKNISLKKDTILLFEKSKFLETTKYNESLEKSFSVQKKKSRNRIIGVGVGGVIVGILFGILLK